MVHTHSLRKSCIQQLSAAVALPHPLPVLQPADLHATRRVQRHLLYEVLFILCSGVCCCSILIAFNKFDMHAVAHDWRVLCFAIVLCCYRLDGKHVVFGTVVEGETVMRNIEKQGSSSGRTKNEIQIRDCGEL